jgi:hypothetical protein
MKWTVLLQYPQTGETYLWSGEAKTAADSAEAAKRQAQEDNESEMDFAFLMAMPGDHWLIHHGESVDMKPMPVDEDFERAVDAFNEAWGLNK